MKHRGLLLRLAAQNVGRRKLRTLLLGAAVMLGVGIGFASFVAGWALRDGIAASFARMGADLIVVPQSTLVNLTASLLTVQPTEATLPAGMEAELATLPGVVRVAPQRIVSALVQDQPAQLIAFDPARDFSVGTWLAEHRPGPLPLDGLIAGSGVPGKPGEALSVCGMRLTVHGRLGRTGVGPFDGSYFISFATLADLIAFCHANGAPAASHAHAALCPGDLPLDRASAFLVQLAPGARIADVRFAAAGLPGVKIVEGNAVLTSARQALGSLLLGIGVFTALQLVALLILVSLLFSAVVQERGREIGLLRAMGARPNQVMAVILGEAALVTGLGGLAGLGFGAALLMLFARSIGFYFGLLGIAFAWPPAYVLAAAAAGALAVSAAIGLAGAFLPAWRVRRAAPYALILADAR